MTVEAMTLAALIRKRIDLLIELKNATERAAEVEGRVLGALERAANEGRNVLPDATDDQAAVIEQWALAVLGDR